jgi:hypothetical protein
MKILPASLAPAFALWALAWVGCSTNGTSELSASSVAPAFDVEVELITGTAEACERVLGPTEPGVRVLSSAAAKSLLADAAGSCNLVSRPRMLVAAGSKGFIITTTKTAYVQDFDADEHPVMGSIEHGVRIDMTPKAHGDDMSELALSIEISGLEWPIRQQDVTLPGSGKAATVQLPVLGAETITTSVVLGAEDVALLPVNPTPGDDPVRAVVLRVHRHG